MLWHRRYGHVGEQNLKSLANGKLVERFDYNSSGLCESCIGGKQHQSLFDSSERQTGDLLELVHSDVCGKISDKSIGGAQYFLTFTDDKSRYSWVYIIKMKDQVFKYFLERKALVEKRLQKRKLEPFVTFPYPTMIHLHVFVSNFALSSRGTCAYASLPNTLRWFTFGFFTMLHFKWCLV